MECSMAKQSVLIIGNGPVEKDFSETLNSFDRVVRFNMCANMPRFLGHKCTDLWLVSKGKQGIKFTAAFPAVDIDRVQNVMITDPQPNRFMQFFYRLIKRKGSIDHGDEITLKYSTYANVERITHKAKEALLKRLYTFGKPVCKAKAPSSGMLAIEYFLQQQAQVYIVGFGFKGWKRHPWNLEKRYVESLIKQHKIQLLKAPACAGAKVL